MPEGGGVAVEGDRPVVGLILPQQLEQCAGEALDGVDHLPRLRDGQGRQRVECAVHQRISIEENKKGLFFRHHPYPSALPQTSTIIALNCDAESNKISNAG